MLVFALACIVLSTPYSLTRLQSRFIALSCAAVGNKRGNDITSAGTVLCGPTGEVEEIRIRCCGGGQLPSNLGLLNELTREVLQYEGSRAF